MKLVATENISPAERTNHDHVYSDFLGTLLKS